MADQAKIKELRRGLQKKAVPFHNVFSTPEGQLVLEAIKDEFDSGLLCTTNEYGTVVRAAQRDVVRYIEDMIKLRNEEFK
jgi:hypothetical protein